MTSTDEEIRTPGRTGRTAAGICWCVAFAVLVSAVACATHATGGAGDGGSNPTGPDTGSDPVDSGTGFDASFDYDYGNPADSGAGGDGGWGPACGTSIPSDYSSVLKGVDYVLFAWNDLGMHCLNPSYSSAVILPPYNTLWAQAVKKGDPPAVTTVGLSVAYDIVGNTYSYGKGRYGEFWDNAQALFGTALAKNTGLNLVDPSLHNGLSGAMAVSANDHFHAEGIPLVPVDDGMKWNPFQVAELALSSGGAVIAQTRTTIPTSDEINCAKCHGNALWDALWDVLKKHDYLSGTRLASAGPVLCASCHGSPALGQTGPGSSGKYLSGAVHAFHAGKGADCYDCHPGRNTRCSRSVPHTAGDGNCTTCHGDLAQVGGSVNSGARVPWVNEPKCVTCHTGVPEVDTGTTLYRNAKGHGGLYCEACHGSPHAMTPSCAPYDNFQAMQYQGKPMTMGDCRVCHNSSRGGDEGGGGGLGEFAGTHGGPNPEHKNACHTCHTVLTTDTTKWPHQYGWKAR